MQGRCSQHLCVYPVLKARVYGLLFQLNECGHFEMLVLVKPVWQTLHEESLPPAPCSSKKSCEPSPFEVEWHAAQLPIGFALPIY